MKRKLNLVLTWLMIAVMLNFTLFAQTGPVSAADGTSADPSTGTGTGSGTGTVQLETGVNPTASGDAYVRFKEDGGAKIWTIGTAQIEKSVTFEAGRFLMTSLVNKLPGNGGKEYAAGGADEFAVKIVDPNNTNGSMAVGSNVWTYENYTTALGSQGELILKVMLKNTNMRVTRSYQILPDTGVIEEWTEFTNLGSRKAIYAEPRMVRTKVMPDASGKVEMYRMSGDKVTTKHTLVKQPVNAAGLTEINGSGADQNHPFVALQYRDSEDGLFFTWDYTGKWVAKVGNLGGMAFVQASVYNSKDAANWTIDVAPGAKVTTPLSRVGVFMGDADDMGNAVTDYQYKYKWQHTNEKFINFIRFGGYGSSPDIIFDKVNANRYIGGDMVWIDDGWQTNLGDWGWKESMPIGKYQEYINKNSQMLGLWAPPWGAEATSQLKLEHPDWYIPYVTGMDARKTGLDTGKPVVVDYIRQKMNALQNDFGGFMLKTDFNQYKDGFQRAQGVMQVLANFKLDHPEQGLHICSDGAGLLNPGSAAYSELILLQDGTPALSDGYYVSMLYPIDKIMTSNGRGNIGEYSKTNRAMLSYQMTVAGKADAAMEELEPIRQDMDLYRYLKTQGVMGRYVKVYRPTYTTDNTYYFVQKMNRNASKGYITVRFDTSLAGTNVTLYPKKLNPAQNYTISTLEGGMTKTTRTGAEWMTQGITLSPLKAGEVIFLNLENRPGSGNDKTAPTAPSNLSVNKATYMNRSGVEISWKAGSDNNWVSYYEIEKNGALYDRVSKGSYYFDVNGSMSDSYRIRTVDGDGNASGYVKF